MVSSPAKDRRSANCATVTQLDEARRDMLARTQLENQTSGGVLHALQRCDRREW